MIQNLIREYNIPVVEQHGSVEEPKAFMQYVHELKNAEGFVIRWADGHRVKIKAHEYLQIHKAKEAILQDRNIVELILEEHLDDVKAHLPAEDRDRLTQFESGFNHSVNFVTRMTMGIIERLRAYSLDKKGYALSQYHASTDGFTRPIIFRFLESGELDYEAIRATVCNTIRNNLGRTAKYEAIRDAWFPGVVYN